MSSILLFMAVRRARLAVLAQADRAMPSGTPHEIVGLQAWPLREPVSRRQYTVLRLETRSGLKGYGECAALSSAALAEARRVVTGRPPTAVEPVRQQLRSYPAAQAAVNMAMLDLTGKIAKAPLYQVLGGPTRNKVRALAPIYGGREAVLRASQDAARAYGYRAFVVPLPPITARNQGRAFVRTVQERMESLRDAGGENADFVLDGAGLLTPGDAASICSALERFHLLWFDEPCPVSNLVAVRKLAQENVTPLGFGRTLQNGGAFQDLLREDTVDLVRPDLALHGITQIRRIAALAETYYVAVAPHHEGGPIGTAAALHLAASLPNFFIQHVPVPEDERDQKMRAAIAGPAIEKVTDGFLSLPTGPGLGIEVNERALDDYKERAA